MASAGSSTAQLLERFKKLAEMAKELKVIAPGKNYPTSSPPFHAKQYEEDYKKTGPGHEAKGAGDGGGDGGRDGGHDDGKPKKGFIFCLVCREYIPSEEFEDHVRVEHPLDGDVDGDD